MDAEHERRVLMQKLSWSRAEIVRVAAAWQASGLDTAALVQPLVQLQQALTILESPADPEQRAMSAPLGRESSHPPDGTLTAEERRRTFLFKGPTHVSVSLAEPTEQELGRLAQLLALIGDPKRLRILLLLAEGEKTVTELTGVLRSPQPTVSHHLASLRTRDLVSARRQGKNIYYSLSERCATEGGPSHVTSAPGVGIRTG